MTASQYVVALLNTYLYFGIYGAFFGLAINMFFALSNYR